MSGIIKELGQGLIIRKGTEKDIESLIKLHEEVQGEGEWTDFLANGSHPNCNAANFLLVEDTINNSRITSSLTYIPQTWTYGGMKMSVWRVEMVSTHPDYRRKGLIQQQFDIIHELSNETENHFVDVIVGKPWFYRKFGYSMALRYWKSRLVSKNAVERFADKEDRYVVEQASFESLSYFKNLFENMKNRYPVTCIREEKNWIYDLFSESKSISISVLRNAEGSFVGAMSHASVLDEGFIRIFACEIDENISWLEAAPSIIKYLNSLGEALAQKDNTDFKGFDFNLEDDHPIYKILYGVLEYNKPTEAPLAWYVRINNLEKFIRYIAPVLEDRLGKSIAVGYSGTLNIGLYDTERQLSLSFDKGKLVSVENNPFNRSDAYFCNETLKQLIFGYKSVKDIEEYTPESLVNNEARIVLDILFPKHESNILSIW